MRGTTPLALYYYNRTLTLLSITSRSRRRIAHKWLSSRRSWPTGTSCLICRHRHHLGVVLTDSSRWPSINVGYDDDGAYTNSSVTSCNGVPIRNLQHLVDVIDSTPADQARHQLTSCAPIAAHLSPSHTSSANHMHGPRSRCVLCGRAGDHYARDERERGGGAARAQAQNGSGGHGAHPPRLQDTAGPIRRPPRRAAIIATTIVRPERHWRVTTMKAFIVFVTTTTTTAQRRGCPSRRRL